MSLDTLIPGWAGMSLIEARWAIAGLDPAIRADVRAALDAALGARVEVPADDGLPVPDGASEPASDPVIVAAGFDVADPIDNDIKIKAAKKAKKEGK